MLAVIEECSFVLPATAAAGLAILAGLIALAGLVLRRANVQGTTLVPTWWWSLSAAALWSATEVAAALAGPRPGSWLPPLRLAAVVLSFCPILAVLGAKRPQHAPWSFVVAALWAILALPAAETYFLQRGQQLEMGAARSWFLWILILIGPINYVPTRQWLAALLVAAGQVLALSEYLPLVQRSLFGGQHVVALVLVSIAAIIARTPRSTAANPYDCLWLDFRDLFGLFWSLRLQERVNAVAAASGWPLWLGWRGFRDPATGRPLKQVDPAIEPTLRTSMRGLLRRFVSNRWIAERLATSTANENRGQVRILPH
jgi:hypothetical protein